MSPRQATALRLGALAMVAAGVLLLVLPGVVDGGGERVRLGPGTQVEVPRAGLFAPAHVTLFAATAGVGADVEVDDLGCEVRQPSGAPSSAELLGPSPFDRGALEVDGAALTPVLRVRAPSASTIRCDGDALDAIQPLYLARRTSPLPVGWLRAGGVVALVVGGGALIALRGSRVRR